MACLESASISVLVNGSPTKEFISKKGLRQGDPLAPFLFLIVVESLAGVFRIVVEKELIEGLKIGKKSVKVNFLKSRIGGVGVKQTKILSFMSVLNCEIMRTPFMYLGLPIGDAIRGIPSKVLKKIMSLQRNFLWGWGADGRKIAWVAWDKRGLWGEVIESKYGGWRGLKELQNDNNKVSLWWRDMMKEANICEYGSRINGIWEWNLRWRRGLFAWEEDQVSQLLETISNRRIESEIGDKWVWKDRETTGFSVKYAYALLVGEGGEEDSRFYNSF
ncbi:uncharacterized protein [Phaseolus vulgaris]|uniref:uncharacterized protein n=1 Tax=Phaseolus vulgaris TaxID=3885 RepID=UPI0035CC63B1